MRRGLVVVGIVLLLLGVVAAVVPMVVPANTSIPPANSAQILTLNIIGSGTVTITWSGADSGTMVSVYQCSSSDCSSTSQIASGSGSSGALSFSASGGTTYAINEVGTSSSVAATLAVVGVTPLVLIGIILVVVGLVLLVFGWRTTAKPRSAASTRPVGAQEGLWSTAPAQGIPASSPGAEGSGGHIMEAADAPAALSGTRPTRICDHCGTPNEPWITNCRKCMRPLASTGQS
jgi:uncharacterized membrane protein/ribosomal protein L40E